MFFCSTACEGLKAWVWRFVLLCLTSVPEAQNRGVFSLPFVLEVTPQFLVSRFQASNGKRETNLVPNCFIEHLVIYCSVRRCASPGAFIRGLRFFLSRPSTPMEVLTTNVSRGIKDVLDDRMFLPFPNCCLSHLTVEYGQIRLDRPPPSPSPQLNAVQASINLFFSLIDMLCPLRPVVPLGGRFSPPYLTYRLHSPTTLFGPGFDTRSPCCISCGPDALLDNGPGLLHQSPR